LLPFGPKDSAPLVESILRVLGRGAHAPTVLGDAGGPSVVKTSSPQSKKSSAAAQFSETGPPVLRAPSGLNVAGGKRSLVLVALGLVVVVAGALGLRARREIRSPASAPRLNDPVAASPSAASATPATSSDAGSAESVESISEADRLMNAQSDLNPLEPLREGPSPLPPTHRPMVSDPPARPVAPVPAARTPSSPTPSTKRHEIDVY
jgi:hypothetical protein